MISRLIDISDISVIDQNKNNNLYRFSSIDYDEAFNEGGFGTIHEVLSIDGKQTGKAYLLKIFKNEEQKEHAYEVIKSLHLKIKRYQGQTRLPIYHTYPEFLGLPFAVFKAMNEDDEKQYVGFLMFNLKNLGFEDYGSDSELSDTFKNLEDQDRLYLSYQLSKVVSFLHDNHFIHSDIKEASIFINPHRKQLALIDYDSGYHFDKQKKPITLGAVGQWISKKWRQLLKTAQSDSISYKDRIHEENWLLANAVFQLIFDVPPFFFLNDGEDQEEYLKNNLWPYTDDNKTLYIEDNLIILNQIQYYLKALTENGLEKIIKSFETIFNEGFNKESKRLSASEWKNILSEIVNEVEPNINEFNSDKVIIKRQNESVSFDWSIDAYNYILLNDELIDIQKTSKEIQLKDSKEIVLSVVNDFNKVEQRIKITADKKEPEIISLNISSKIRKDKNDFITISWDTKNVEKVKISSINEELLSNGNINLYPTEKTRYKLIAIGYFGQETIKDFELNVIKPTIKDFNYKVNIEKGIENVDLFWDVSDAHYIEINPKVGRLESLTGELSVDIKEKTKFTLIAFGDFSRIEKEIEAQPFPIPIIKELIFDFPKLEKSFKTTNIIDWGDLDKNEIKLIHPEFQLNFPKFQIELSKDLPSFSADLSVDLSQKFVSDISIGDLDFVKLKETV